MIRANSRWALAAKKRRTPVPVCWGRVKDIHCSTVSALSSWLRTSWDHRPPRAEKTFWWGTPSRARRLLTAAASRTAPTTSWGGTVCSSWARPASKMTAV